ncbi:MAG TPA: radical SAM protein [Terriglobales bacterium]|nr:radical SAM protein [Terriglobales bacterium]
MVGCEQKYLTLCEGTEIHLTPDETLVFQESSEARYRTLDFLKTNLHYVNSLGTDILLECNEGLTKQNLLQRLQRKEMSLKAITGFLEESIKRGIIGTEDEPSYRKMRVTGRRQYFIPVHFSIELTSQCNLKCIYCYNESDVRKYQRLSTTQLLKCLNTLLENGIRIVELTGGEPLLHPDFLEIVDFCGTRFILVSILTNGTLVDKTVAKGIAKYKNKLMVQIDLDGSTAVVHDGLRGVPGCFEKAKKGIEFLARDNILVKVAMNVVPSNVNDIENTLQIAKQCGAYMFSYSPITDVGRAKDLRLSWSPVHLKKLEELPKYLHERYGNFLFQLKEDQIEHFLKR